MFVAQLQSHSSSTPSRQKKHSSRNATGLQSKSLYRRPIRQTLQRPKPIPPDIGAGPTVTQQQKQTLGQQQQTATMGTTVKSGTSLKAGQDMLVDYLIRSRLVKSPRVAEALRAVDRGKYINTTYASRADAYSVGLRSSHIGSLLLHCI